MSPLYVYVAEPATVPCATTLNPFGIVILFPYASSAFVFLSTTVPTNVEILGDVDGLSSPPVVFPPAVPFT